MSVRQQLRFYGRVQGVGFRFTAKYLASSLGITGWVLNDYDGSVLMEAQASDLFKINSLIEKLDSDTFICIDRIEKNNIPPLPYESCFEIKDEY